MRGNQSERTKRNPETRPHGYIDHSQAASAALARLAFLKPCNAGNLTLRSAEREKGRDRQTDRQTERDKETERGRDRQRQTYRQRQRNREREREH